MTLEEIRLAITTRLVGWEDAPIAWDNLPSPPAVLTAQADKAPWIRVTVLHGVGIPAQLDDAVMRSGILAIQIFTGRHVGERPGLLLVDSLTARLEHYRADGLRLRQANPSRIGLDDGWHQINLNVPFIAH